MSASSSVNTLTHDKLIAGDQVGVVHRSITLISGQNLARGAVLGKITASGKYNLSLSAAGDGSQTPDLILAESTDASAGDVVTVAYEAGVFAESGITLGTAHTVASVKEGLRAKGIHLVPIAAA